MEDDALLKEQIASRQRSGRRWARFSLCLGVFALLSPFLAAGLEELVQQIEMFSSFELLFDALTSLSIFAMLPVGLAAVAAGYWAGLRAPKGIRNRRTAVERILGMTFGSVAALLIIGFLAVGFCMFGIPG